MPNGEPCIYFHAASKQKGALGIVHIYADEESLSAKLDGHLPKGLKPAGAHTGNLESGDLRHGWLIGSAGEKIDEVMLAKPVSGMRILMTHGGYAVRDSVDVFLRASGFRELADSELNADAGILPRDDILDPLLAATLTDSQAAAILEAKAQRGGGKQAPSLPEAILALHRIVLSGPPNAGKSSLLNRLAGYDRAFVHAEAGATTDVVDEIVDLGGYAVLVGDMPGFSPCGRAPDDPVWKKALARLQGAEIVFFLLDGSIPWNDATASAAKAIRDAMARDARALVIVNKSDLPCAVEGEPWRDYFPNARGVRLCSLPEGDIRETLDAEMRLLLAEGSVTGHAISATPYLTAIALFCAITSGG